MSDSTASNVPSRTLSYRSVAVGVFGMLLLAMWVMFHEVLVPTRTTLVENSPPAGAVAVFLGVVVIGVLLGKLGKGFHFSAGELAVVYAMLVTSAPIMTQGMWQRILGLTAAIPTNEHNARLSDSFSDALWPHGSLLVEDPCFEQGLSGQTGAEDPGRIERIVFERSPVGEIPALEIRHDAQDSTQETVTEFTVTIDRFSGKKEVLIPGERYYFSYLQRIQEMRHGARVIVELRSDNGSTLPIDTVRRATEDIFSTPGGVQRSMHPYVNLPRDIDRKIELVFRLEGIGTAAFSDVRLFSNEALARLYKGVTEIRESDYPHVPGNDRDALLVRPDNLLSMAGLAYVIKGYVPWSQWWRPLAYWFGIVILIFGCMFSISVMLRRQWEDVERFSFPLATFPRMLIGGDGEPSVFRTRMFRAGLITALVLAMFRGFAHFVPGMPSFDINVDLSQYVASQPVSNAFVRGMAGGRFSISWAAVAIAVFIDLEMLASILIFMLLARVPFALGEITGWKQIRGPMGSFPFVHEQHLGAFFGLAIVVLWVSRKHLGQMLRTVFGRRGGLDDSREALRYRTATILMLVCLGGMALWGSVTGLGAMNAMFFFGFLVICGLSAARIRTECGIPGTYFTPYYPFLIFLLLGGLRIFNPATLVLAFVAGGFMAVAQFLMFAPTQVEMMCLANRLNVSIRGVSTAVFLGLLGGLVLGGYVMLVWAYGVGGENVPHMRSWTLHQDWYLSTLRKAMHEADSVSRAAQPSDSTYGPGAWVATGVGVLIPIVITVLRSVFVRFWISPLGYVLANSHFIYGVWGSLLVAWVIKSASLKLGGARFIREKMMPFFVGVFCGWIGGMLFWDLVSLILMAQGSMETFTLSP